MSKPAFANRGLGVPVVDISLSAASPPYDVASGTLPSLLVGGQFVWELRCVLSASQLASEQRVIDATIGGGNFYVVFNSTAGGYWRVGVNGSDVLELGASDRPTYNNKCQYAVTGQELRVIVAYLPRFNLCAIGLIVNGVATNYYTGTASTVLGTISALRLGAALDGSAALPGTLSRFRAYHPSALTLAPIPGASGKPPTLWIGDSVQQSIQTMPGSAASTLIYSAAQVASDDAPWCVNNATPGDKVEDQQTSWAAGPWASCGTVARVVVCADINNANAGAQTQAQITGHNQTLVTALGAALPSARLLWALATPCKSGIGATNWANLDGANQDLRNGVVTGISTLVTAHYTLLDDGHYGGTSGNLYGPAANGDNIHPLTGVEGDPAHPGRVSIADAVAAAL